MRRHPEDLDDVLILVDQVDGSMVGTDVSR
jgi:hypothetical protein